MKKPAKRLRQVKLAKDSRRVLTSIRRTIRKQRYRKDLKMVSHNFLFNKNYPIFIFLGCSSSSIRITSWSTINFNNCYTNNSNNHQTFRQKHNNKTNNNCINKKSNIHEKKTVFFSFLC